MNDRLRPDPSSGSPAFDMISEIKDAMKLLDGYIRDIDDHIRGNGREGILTRLSHVERSCKDLRKGAAGMGEEFRESLSQMESEVHRVISELKTCLDTGQPKQLAVEKEKTTRQKLINNAIITTQVCTVLIVVVEYIIPLF